MRDDNATAVDPAKWTAGFQERYGRPPRILHIGNIANNAYNNAKLLNRAGFDCDVVCHDYYHMMGSPEWEDADFGGDIQDHFFPDWGRVDLHGFRRPRWFVQGPGFLCLDYLASRRGTRWGGVCRWSSFEFMRRLHTFACVFGRRTPFATWGWQAGLYALARLGAWMKGDPRPKSVLPGLARKFVARFRAAFPGRKDPLRPSDLAIYTLELGRWRRVMANYDLVVGYSTDPIYPLLVGKRPYCAIEHGTLRSIPFERTPQGRVTALSYHCADHVFVTNSDCLGNARRLAPGRVTFINHPYDEDHGVGREGSAELRAQLQRRLDAEFLVFFPTRHDWVPGAGYADKANDVFLRAFVRLRAEGLPLGVVCCRWGSNVEQSRALLREAGCDRHALWVEPMGTVRFERTALACDLVADQFKLGAFGGVLFKAMAAGAPVLTYLDTETMRLRYGETPPALNARTEAEVAAALRRAVESPEMLKGLREASRAWIKEHYASRDTVRRQVEVYAPLIEAAMDREPETQRMR